MREEIIRKTKDFMTGKIMVLAGFPGNNERMARYRIEHSVRVARIGKAIAEAEGMDPERMFVACLLHDVGYTRDYRQSGDFREHGRVGAAIARPFLEGLGVYSLEEIREMCYGIAIHVDDRADFEGERTPFALTVGDADNIDRFDAYRLFEAFHFADYTGLSLEQQREMLDRRTAGLCRLRDAGTGTQTAKRMWQEKIDYQLEFCRRLKDQTENSVL